MLPSATPGTASPSRTRNRDLDGVVANARAVLEESSAPRMKPSAARECVLERRGELHHLIDRLHDVARGWTSDGRRRVLEICKLTEQLCQRLSAQITLEERILAPALRGVDGWGDLRVQMLFEHHRRQRAAIRWLAEVPVSFAASSFADEVQWLASHIQSDLSRAEASLLGEDLLRDDVVGVDVEGG